MSEEVNGSVLVVGGGIAGMQSALDLANSGYYVYLLEKSPSIIKIISGIIIIFIMALGLKFFKRKKT